MSQKTNILILFRFCRNRSNPLPWCEASSECTESLWWMAFATAELERTAQSNYRTVDGPNAQRTKRAFSDIDTRWTRRQKFVGLYFIGMCHLILTISLENTIEAPFSQMYLKYNSLQMDQLILALPSREYYLKNSSRSDLQAYYQYMTKLALLLGADTKTAERDMTEVLNFEIQLANVGLLQITSWLLEY